MSALAGWAVAVAALTLAVASWHELRRRGELVARACHEVRGPLTAARLALHASAGPGEALAPPLAAVDAQLRRAGVALDDLAAARRGRRAGDVDQEVDMGAILAAQAAAWRTIAAALGRRLRVTVPAIDAVVRGDARRLGQAIGNLIANALEHGGGTVELRARVIDHRARIEIADEGSGLPAPIRELAGRPRAGIGRRGRGLAIASDIVARHGGRITTAPSARGARVAIELPLLRAGQTAAMGAGRGGGAR